MKELEERFGLLFEKLKVVGIGKLVQERVEPLLIKHKITPLRGRRKIGSESYAEKVVVK